MNNAETGKTVPYIYCLLIRLLIQDFLILIPDSKISSDQLDESSSSSHSISVFNSPASHQAIKTNFLMDHSNQLTVPCQPMMACTRPKGNKRSLSARDQRVLSDFPSVQSHQQFPGFKSHMNENTSFAALSLFVGTLDAWLTEKNMSLLLIDVRSFVSYNSSHINQALNVHCPTIVKRRNLGGTMPLEYVVPCMTQRSRLQAGDISRVVIYDQNSMLPPVINSNVHTSQQSEDSTLVLVLRSLAQIVPVDSLYFLQGN